MLASYARHDNQSCSGYCAPQLQLLKSKKQPDSAAEPDRVVSRRFTFRVKEEETPGVRKKRTRKDNNENESGCGLCLSTVLPALKCTFVLIRAP